MPNVVCGCCKNSFYAKPSWIRYGNAKFCSRGCQYKARKTGKVMTCFICKKETYKTKKQLRVSASKKYFCSKSCQAKWRNTIFIGAKHANWIHGFAAYRTILTRNKVPKVCTLCKIDDGRVLATHHIDKNRKNNKLDNLTWLCHNCHFLVHHYHGERERLIANK